MSTLLYGLSQASGEHPAAWWLAKSGKLLQFLAGLAVALDLVGRERLRSAHKRATRQRALLREIREFAKYDHLPKQLAETILGAPIEATVVPGTIPINGSVIPHVKGYRFSVSPPAAVPPLLSAADVKEFIERASTRIRAECPCSEQHDDRICPDQAIFIETEAVQEVARRLGLSEQAHSFLTAQHSRYGTDGGLSGCIIPLMVTLGAAGVAAFFLALRQVIPAVVGWAVFVAGSAFAMALQHRRVRINTHVRVTVAAVRVLSSWGLFLLGRQATGDPVKWAALVLFIAGSILDLVWG
ncbi:hypothetical protein ACIBG4_19550 [Nonomuraea sp. NPDC050383]|uniref:hypothetical protein n=1 Tax=Nonomuraea sp. NPDC050383 TaxID=3364362 RepID=UPI0037BAF3FB